MDILFRQTILPEGYRARLPLHFRTGEAGALTDAAQLESLLSFAIARRDVQPLAQSEIFTVVSRTGNRKPAGELLDLKPLDEPPKKLATSPPPILTEPPANRPKRKFTFDE